MSDEKLRQWIHERIEACRASVYAPFEPSVIVNHIVREVERQHRLMSLIELRVLSAVLRGLDGKDPIAIKGCGACTRDNACFDGSVECERERTSL